MRADGPVVILVGLWQAAMELAPGETAVLGRADVGPGDASFVSRRQCSVENARGELKGY